MTEESGSAKTLPATPVSGETVLDVPSGRTEEEPDRPRRLAPSGLPVKERIDALVDRESRAKYRERLLFSVRLAIWIWLGFWLVDVVTWLGGAGPLWLIALGRFGPLAYALTLGAALRRRVDASRAWMRFMEVSAFGVAMCGSSLIYISAGGWSSARVAGASLLVMGHAVMLGGNWRYSWIAVATMVLTLPATFLGASAVVPEMAAQLSDPMAMRLFLTHYTIVLGAAFISLVGGHIVWTLRQEVAAAKSIGRYRLRRRIAAGGMGEVWAAYHAGLQRDVALKLVQPALGNDAVAVERFEREVRTLAELTHPNIIRVFDYGATETGVWYYAMELLDAEDLQTIVDRDGPLEPARATRLLVQAAEALGEAHARGIVHRDLKPANLLVARTEGAREFVKVIDFGIAAQEGGTGLTQTGMVVGTPGFIAPEAIVGGEATSRSDVYSLGMVLYVLLTGAMPYPDAKTPDALVRAAMAEAPERPSKRCRDLPSALDDVVVRCLARDPQARYANGGELAGALRRARDRF